MHLFKYSKYTVQNSLSTYIKKNLFKRINPFTGTSCKCMNGSHVSQKGTCYIEMTTIQNDTLRNAIRQCRIRGLALDEHILSAPQPQINTCGLQFRPAALVSGYKSNETSFKTTVCFPPPYSSSFFRLL